MFQSGTLQFMRIVEEEIGGQLGMKLLVNMKEFKDLNVGFALDEGIVSTVVMGRRT
jgi:aminoacylase